MTGISAVCGSALSWREAPEPSISGMPRSATIRSRRSRRAEGQGGVAVGRLEGLVALAGQYLDHDTAVVDPAPFPGHRLSLTREQIWGLGRYMRSLCQCEGPSWSRDKR